MGIQRAQEDSWTKEMAKFESRPVLVNGTYIEPISRENGGKANHPFQPFPKMLYQAESADGGPQICGYKIVQDEIDERVALGQGWSDGQQAALDAVGARELEMAKQSAHRVHQERWMSEGAKAHAAEIDETTIHHVAEIPETPVRKRRTKAEMAAAKGSN